MNLYEYEPYSRLADLKEQYVDIKKKEASLREDRNGVDAEKMERLAKEIAAEILKSDPEFLKDFDLKSGQEIKNKLN